MPQTNQDVTFSRGPSASIPIEYVAGRMLIETDTGNMFLDNTDEERIQIKDSTKLPLTGGVVAGDTEFQNVSVSGSLTVSGITTLNSDLNMQNNIIHNLDAPQSATDAANKNYVDSNILQVNQAISDVSDSLTATVSSVDSALNSHIQNVDNPHDVSAEQTGAVSMHGGTITGSLVVTSDGETGGSIEVQHVDISKSLSVDANGSIDFGSVTVSNIGEPINSSDAATKSYVDNAAAGAGSDKFIPISDMGEPNGVATLDSTGLLSESQRPNYDDKYLSLAGGTINGPLSLEANNSLRFIGNPAEGIADVRVANGNSYDTIGKILFGTDVIGGSPVVLSNVYNPSDRWDVANKDYVDNAIQSAVSGSGIVIQNSAPTSTSVCWIDTSEGGVFKYYDTSTQQWKPIVAVWG